MSIPQVQPTSFPQAVQEGVTTLKSSKQTCLHLSKKSDSSFRTSYDLVRDPDQEDRILILAKQRGVVKDPMGQKLDGSVKKFRNAKNVETGEEVAFLILQHEANTNVVRNEYNFLRQYKKCRGIAQVICMFEYDKTKINPLTNKPIHRIVLCVKKYKCLDLLSQLRNCALTNRKLSDECMKNMVLDLAHGLHTLHQNNVVHRDIKLENVLFDGEHFAIADFDAALTGEHDKRVKGSPNRHSPEKILASKSGKLTNDVERTSDIWGLALVWYEFHYFRGVPWENMKDRKEQQETILSWEPVEPSDKESIHYLIWEMLNRDPLKRPTSLQILERVKKIYTAPAEVV